MYAQASQSKSGGISQRIRRRRRVGTSWCEQISRRPQAGGKLLFDDLPDYRFSLYVTNLDLPLDQVWNI
jgi:hypothetical protein